MNEDDNKVFFHSGDVVTLKQDIPNKPVMIVRYKVQAREVSTTRNGVFEVNSAPKAAFIGIKCFWFTEQGLFQEQIFNSKDLEKC